MENLTFFTMSRDRYWAMNSDLVIAYPSWTVVPAVFAGFSATLFLSLFFLKFICLRCQGEKGNLLWKMLGMAFGVCLLTSLGGLLANLPNGDIRLHPDTAATADKLEMFAAGNCQMRQVVLTFDRAWAGAEPFLTASERDYLRSLLPPDATPAVTEVGPRDLIPPFVPGGSRPWRKDIRFSHVSASTDCYTAFLWLLFPLSLLAVLAFFACCGVLERYC